MTRTWWRRNLAALLSLVILVPATLYVVIGLPIIDIVERLPEPQLIAANSAVTANGFEWKLTDSAEFAGTGVNENKIPIGMTLIAAIITVTPSGSTPVAEGVLESCDFELTDRSDTEVGERTWTALSDTSTYGYGRGEDTKAYCDTSATEPYEMEVVYIARSGTYDTATIDITLSGEPDGLLRMALVQP